MTEPVGVVERDAGLAHLRRATRWMVAGALGLAGILTLIVSQALPGRPATASTPSAGSSTPPSTNPATTAPNLQAPAQAPTPTTSPAPVLSGGS